MTDNEVIKALECRIDNFSKSVLDLIKRQKAEIERLNIELQSMRSAANSYKMHYEAAKSEAIKEFAERLKSYAKELHIGDNISWLVLGVGRVDQLVKEMTEV